MSKVLDIIAMIFFWIGASAIGCGIAVLWIVTLPFWIWPWAFSRCERMTGASK